MNTSAEAAADAGTGVAAGAGAPRLDSLTGLRFLAAFAVFAKHCDALFDERSSLADHLLRPGATGVSFFFLLSGFVMAWAWRPGDDTPAYYRRRFARIYPLYALLMVATFVLLLAVSGGLGRPEAGHGETPVLALLPCALLLQSWIPSPRYFFAGNGSSWSLSTEAFFYVLFPFLIPRLGRRAPRAALTGAAALVVVVLVYPLLVQTVVHDPELRYWSIYIAPVPRLAEFVIGILLATAMRHGWRSPVPLRAAALVSAGAYVAAGWTPESLHWAATTVIPFCLLITALAAADLEGQPTLVRRRPIVLLGQWSYAFYLLHQLVIRVGQKVQDVTGNDGGAFSFGLTLAALGISLVGSWLLFTYVERPLERQLRERRTLPVSAGGAGHRS